MCNQKIDLQPALQSGLPMQSIIDKAEDVVRNIQAGQLLESLYPEARVVHHAQGDDTIFSVSETMRGDVLNELEEDILTNRDRLVFDLPSDNRAQNITLRDFHDAIEFIEWCVLERPLSMEEKGAILTHRHDTISLRREGDDFIIRVKNRY